MWGARSGGYRVRGAPVAPGVDTTILASAPSALLHVAAFRNVDHLFVEAEVAIGTAVVV